MQRITISLDDDLLEAIDKLSATRGYTSRSEALRDIVRDAVLQREAASDSEAPCFAVLSYLFDHETRDLAQRLTSAQHHRHDLSVSTLHVHVDSDECLEVAVLKGRVGDVRTFADSVVTQRGVRFGNLHVVPTPLAPGHHHHAHHGHSHDPN